MSMCNFLVAWQYLLWLSNVSSKHSFDKEAPCRRVVNGYRTTSWLFLLVVSFWWHESRLYQSGINP